MSRRRWLLGLALCGATAAVAQPRLELAATAAWNGWSRPGRATEVDVRLNADAATRATLDVAAGRQVVHASVDLEPGRSVRLHVPIEAAEEVAVSVGSPAAPPQRRDVRIAQSEAPLLGAALATADAVRLDGFHTVALAADDLPRDASAYASVDALILDGPTLEALDRRQLGALLVHAAQCGRVVLLNTDPGVRRALDAAAGCGGRALMSAASVADAVATLKSSLAASLAPDISLVGMRELAQPGRAAWDRVIVLVAAYFAVATLALVLVRAVPLLLLVPALATVAIAALLHGLEPPPQLVVWSEGESGAPVARYDAWQLFEGIAWGRVRVTVPPQLGTPRSCEPDQPMRFDFDAGRGRLAFAEFHTRLFRQTALCYAGMLPLERAIAVEAQPDASLRIRNAGRAAWPSGELLAGGVVHDLPALGHGDSAIVRIESGKPVADAATRIAMAHTPSDRVAALWTLDANDPAPGASDGRGWLLLTAPAP